MPVSNGRLTFDRQFEKYPALTGVEKTEAAPNSKRSEKCAAP
jgi:hypothetical protein